MKALGALSAPAVLRAVAHLTDCSHHVAGTREAEVEAALRVAIDAAVASRTPSARAAVRAVRRTAVDVVYRGSAAAVRCAIANASPWGAP